MRRESGCGPVLLCRIQLSGLAGALPPLSRSTRGARAPIPSMIAPTVSELWLVNSRDT